MTDIRGSIVKNDKLVVCGDPVNGYGIYYLIFSADHKECTPYLYTREVYKTEYQAERHMKEALTK